MTPTLLLRDGRPVAGFGSPGSATIISTVLQMVLRVVDFGESLPQAVEAPRFALSTARDEAAFEPGWAPDLLAGLRALGHSTRELPRSLGSVQAVGLPIDAASGPEGAADSRRDGTVVKVSR
jgi:gamma-glutamyltranspeptidase/glutathione hydrolase